MHVTASELDLVPSAVAAIAIIGGYLGVRSASRGQLRLSREAYQRDRLTETYLDVLKGVHLRNAQLTDSYSRPIGAPSHTPKASEFDPTTADETLFAARLAAYASPEVDQMWGDFAKRTTEFDNLMNMFRAATGTPPAEFHGAQRQEIDGTFDRWRQLREDLKHQIRRELHKTAR
jgi:uncharacterized protein YukE